MKKIVGSLPFKLVLGVVIGILVGQVANEGVMNVVVTIKYILNQVINFCVPLIIIGFIAPSITKLGNNASKMLGIALVLAYVSSLGAALFSMAAGYGLIPHLSIDANVEGLKELPKIVFQLDIPQIMPVMSALVFSVLIGLAATWTKAKTITTVLEEFQKIVLDIVTKIVIPILPIFIGFTFCALSYEGTITKQLPVFIQVVLIVMIGHFIWMALLYVLAGIYSGENPWTVVKNYGPAYPPVRLGSDRSFRWDDSVKNLIWEYSVVWDNAVILCTAWCICNRSAGSSGRNSDGISWIDHGSAWV